MRNRKTIISRDATWHYLQEWAVANRRRSAVHLWKNRDESWCWIHNSAIHFAWITSKKVVSRWISHRLTEFQKTERVRIYRETLETLNNGGHRIVSKIVTGDKTYHFTMCERTKKCGYGWMKMHNNYKKATFDESSYVCCILQKHGFSKSH